ncbi:MAG TPA: PHP domain-containing protein [Candidatus Scybalocola faecipullorum]|nr:PHP domain-containing protein [Candidatus Scybalocola faecipullorum]
MKTVDLHTHSNISDGSMTPEELMRHAAACGLSAVALTDHDTIGGIARARQAALQAHIEFIPGIEFAAYYKDREVHIVGLFINEQTPEFIDAVQQTAADRDARNGAMIQKMREAGIDITLEALHKEEGRGVLTRANFASCLVRRGIVSSNQEAFDKYLGKDKPFYVPRKKLKPEDAIRRIHEAGGIAVLAHPLLYHFTDTQLDQCVCDLKAMGIQALEAYYSKNGLFDTDRMKKLADKYGLYYSGGSDFHGTYKPDIEIGKGRGDLVVPYEVLEKLKTLL